MLIVIYCPEAEERDRREPSSVQLVVLLVFFLPFSYFMDTMMYRQLPQADRRPDPAAQRKRKTPKT